MDSKRQKHAVQATDKAVAPQRSLSQHEMPDERYPGSFFRIPGVPVPGKTTWSLTQ